MDIYFYFFATDLHRLSRLFIESFSVYPCSSVAKIRITFDMAIVEFPYFSFFFKKNKKSWIKVDKSG